MGVSTRSEQGAHRSARVVRSMLRLFSMLLLGMAVATACSSSPAPVEAAGALDAIGIQQADQVDLTNFLQVPVDATEDDPGPAVNEILLFTSLEEDLDGARLRYETRLRSEDGDTLVRTVAADVDPTGADAAWAVETDGLQFTTELFDQVRDENIGIWTVTVRGEIELVDDRIIPFNGRYEFAVVPPAGPERVPIVRPTPIPIPAATSAARANQVTA